MKAGSPYVQHEAERLGIVKKEDPFAWMRETIYEPKPVVIAPMEHERPWLKPVLLTAVIIAVATGIILALSGVQVPQL